MQKASDMKRNINFAAGIFSAFYGFILYFGLDTADRNYASVFGKMSVPMRDGAFWIYSLAVILMAAGYIIAAAAVVLKPGKPHILHKIWSGLILAGHAFIAAVMIMFMFVIAEEKIRFNSTTINPESDNPVVVQNFSLDSLAVIIIAMTFCVGCGFIIYAMIKMLRADYENNLSGENVTSALKNSIIGGIIMLAAAFFAGLYVEVGKMGVIPSIPVCAIVITAIYLSSRPEPEEPPEEEKPRELVFNRYSSETDTEEVTGETAQTED